MKQTQDSLFSRPIGWAKSAGREIYKRMTWENAVRASMVAGAMSGVGAAGAAFMAAETGAAAGAAAGTGVGDLQPWVAQQ